MTDQTQFYAGVVQEGCPQSILETLTEFAELADDLNIGYRSTACQMSAPFDEVHGGDSTYTPVPRVLVREEPEVEDVRGSEAFQEALRFRPDLENAGLEVAKHVTRLTHVVLGQDLRTPVREIVLWTPNGREQMKGASTRPIDIIRHIATWHHIKMLNIQDIRSFVTLQQQMEYFRKRLRDRE